MNIRGRDILVLDSIWLDNDLWSAEWVIKVFGPFSRRWNLFLNVYMCYKKYILSAFWSVYWNLDDLLLSKNHKTLIHGAFKRFSFWELLSFFVSV